MIETINTPIPPLPKTKHQSVFEAGLEDRFPFIDFEEETRKRLVSGNAKHGTAWCSADTKSALLDQIFDALNYSRMLLMRMEMSEIDMPDEARMDTISVLGGLVGQLLAAADGITKYIPDFETS